MSETDAGLLRGGDFLPGPEARAEQTSRVPQGLVAEVQMGTIPYCKAGATGVTGCPVRDNNRAGDD